MKNKIEITLQELGYFTVGECEAIKDVCEGTYMHIEVKWCNYAGNCTLIICSDYQDDDLTEEETVQAIKNMFFANALSNIRILKRGLAR
jgi:hypothetical protein